MGLRYLSKSKLAEVTGKNRATISKLLEGLEPFSSKNNIVLYDAHLALPIILQVRSSAGIEKKLQEEELRYETAKADKMELEVQKRRGELVEINKVAATVEQEYSAVRATLLAVPTKVAHTLSTVTEPAEIQSKLQDAINEVLTELSADKRYATENPSEEYEPTNDESGSETNSEPSESIEAQS